MNSNLPKRKLQVKVKFPNSWRAIPGVAAGFLFAVTCFASLLFSQTTPSGPSISVSRISVIPSVGGTVISISARVPLYKVQKWQDSEGYHVVVPNAKLTALVKPSPGVMVLDHGTSVEILVQTEPGAGVNAWNNKNRLNLSIDGLLKPRPNDQATVPKLGQSSAPLKKESQTAFAQNAIASGSKNSAGSATGGLFISSVVWSASISIVFALGAFSFPVLRKIRSKGSRTLARKETSAAKPTNQPVDAASTGNSEAVENSDRSRVDTYPVNSTSTEGGSTLSPAAASMYGAYRIDQEVGKLLPGQPYRMDVLASRSPDDRRAIETLLLKAISDTDRVGRAREALEGQGFVPRLCATMLLDPVAFDRAAAARALGQIKSSTALPFLIEALFDQESSVRNQAIVSIGELRQPSAIGVLLDKARRLPDIPYALLREALNACLVEAVDCIQQVNEKFDSRDVSQTAIGLPCPAIQDEEQFGLAAELEAIPTLETNSNGGHEFRIMMP